MENSMNHPNQSPAALLREEDAARYICMSRSFLRQSRMTGVLKRGTPGPPYIRIGRCIRYQVKDLDSWIARHRKELLDPRGLATHA